QPDLPSFPTRRSSDIHFGGERRVAPQRGIAGRHDVDMAGEAEMGRALADAGIEIVHRRRALFLEIEAPEREARGLERLDQHLQRSEEHTSELQSRENL